MATNLYGSICLSDIPKELIQTGKNGKLYLNIDINERRQPSQYGHTHYIKVYMGQDKGNVYIGDLKPSRFNGEPTAEKSAEVFPPKSGDPLAAKAQEFINAVEDDDLPF